MNARIFSARAEPSAPPVIVSQLISIDMAADAALGLTKKRGARQLPNGEATTEHRKIDDRNADHRAPTPLLPHRTVRYGPCHATDVTMHLHLHDLPVQHVFASADVVNGPTRRTCNRISATWKNIEPGVICETVLLERTLYRGGVRAAWRLCMAHVSIPMLQITVEEPTRGRNLDD